MGGKPCIRGMRVTVGTIVGLVASGHSKEDVLRLYPYLVPEDIDDKVSRLKLKSMGIQLQQLTPEQKKYMASWEMGT